MLHRVHLPLVVVAKVVMEANVLPSGGVEEDQTGVSEDDASGLISGEEPAPEFVVSLGRMLATRR